MKDETNIFQKLRKASRLSPADWLFFIQAWVWLLVFDLGLRIRPFPDLQIFASKQNMQVKPSPEQVNLLLQRLRDAVNRAGGSHLYPMTCLRRSLALQKMLAQKAIPTELKIGMHKESGSLMAHAWLEFRGTPLGEPERITEKFIAFQNNVPA